MKCYNNHFMSVKAAKNDQDIKLVKAKKDTVQLYWLESADTFINALISHHGAPLVYALRKDNIPISVKHLLLTNKCFLEYHNLVKEELTMFSSHGHTLFKDDCALIYESIE